MLGRAVVAAHRSRSKVCCDSDGCCSVGPLVPPVLAIAGVSKNFGGLRPLRLQELTVDAGEQVALVGFDQPSAEVFVNLVTGATLPDAGTISLFGRPTADIVDSADWLAVVDRFGIVSARAVLLDQLTVIQNLAMPFTLGDRTAGRRDPPARESFSPRTSGCRTPRGRSRLVRSTRRRARIRLGRASRSIPASCCSSTRARTRTGGRRGVRRRRARDRVATRHRRDCRHRRRDVRRGGAPRVLAWEPATGRLIDRRRRGWFRRRQ